MRNLSSKKAFKVTYTKKVGGDGTIIVQAPNEEKAIINANQHCFTGKDFRDAIEVPFEEYTTPSKQGFQGSDKAN